ncbi:hypothetical protein Taro_016928 [Colocasia esculenta]|uniref:Uncharacterized protein n=1 Tax=Colocasia esculenta TaxID=4460 RepID=A0A843ULQ5_COLES|nr:hypothetical protein [Colocasia esculenta]
MQPPNPLAVESIPFFSHVFPQPKGFKNTCQGYLFVFIVLAGTKASVYEGLLLSRPDAEYRNARQLQIVEIDSTRV